MKEVPDSVRSKPLLRHRWSHRMALHRLLVRLYNSVAAVVPFRIKFGFGLRSRSGSAPYALLSSKSVAVQVGAPRDTLRAGRSRGMYFALLAGRTVIIEPDPASAKEFGDVVARQRLAGVDIINSGAWSEHSKLTLYVDPKHPATNFTEGEVDYSAEEMARFIKVEVPADRIDDIVERLGIEDLDVLSLTTNGGEVSMLEGATRTLARTAYVCLRKDCDEGTEFLQATGYEFYSFDDRGVTLKNTALTVI